MVLAVLATGVLHHFLPADFRVIPQFVVVWARVGSTGQTPRRSSPSTRALVTASLRELTSSLR